jgi:septation ring formation regulator EzrA
MYKILTLSEEYIPIEDLGLKVRRDIPALITQEEKDSSKCLQVLVNQRKVHVQSARPLRKRSRTSRKESTRVLSSKPLLAASSEPPAPVPPTFAERLEGMEQDLNQVLRVLNRTVSDLAQSRADFRQAVREISILKGRVTRLQNRIRRSERGEKNRKKDAGSLRTGDGEE